MRGALSLRAVRLGRFSAAVAALLVLLAGQVDPHAWLEGSHEHHLAGGLQELAFDHLHVHESHPDQPLHVEGSHSDRHHRCVQCLFQQFAGVVDPAAPAQLGRVARYGAIFDRGLAEVLKAAAILAAAEPPAQNGPD